MSEFFLSIFSIFDGFWMPFRGSVLGQKCEKMKHGKASGKVVEYLHAGHAAVKPRSFKSFKNFGFGGWDPLKEA